MDPETCVEQRLEALRALLEDPIAWLGERLGLTPTEEHVLRLLVGHELCPEIRTRLRSLATEVASEPTRELLHRLVYRSTASAIAWRELGESGALQRLGLVERTDTGPDASYRHTLKVSRRVLAVVHGERELDAALAGIARIVDEDPPALEIDAAIVERVRDLLCASDAMVVMHGGAGTGRRSLLVSLARERGLQLLAIDARALASEPARELRTIARECALLGLTPLITSLDALAASESAPDRFALFERELAGGLVLATSSRPIARRWHRPTTFVELPRPTGRQRARLWSRALPDADSDALATMYPLSPALIAAAGAAAVRAGGDVDTGVRSVVDDRLAGLATRVTTAQTWDGVIRRDDPGSPLPTRRDFGPHDAITSDPEMGLSEVSGTNFFVPDEFIEAALARHEEMWGGAPTTVHVDDSNWHWDPARSKAAAEHKRHKTQVAHTNPPVRAPAAPAPPRPATPIVIPDALKLRRAGAP